jgi:F-type H+-transporting ATP synthase subunit e
VLRYSALLFGIFYGFTHQRTVTSNIKASHVEHEYKHKESLIEKAKLEWKKKNLPPGANGGGKSYSSGLPNSELMERYTVITDPDDKNFDLEAFLNMKAAETT